MPFKPKTEKKIVVDQKATITLDGKHSEMVENINYLENKKIPELQAKIESLKSKLSKSQSLEEQLEIKDSIKLYKTEIKEIKKSNKNYYLDNSKFVFEYFEQKKNISDGNTTNQLENTSSTKNIKVLDDFFKIKPPKDASNNDEKSFNSNNNDNIVKDILNQLMTHFLILIILFHQMTYVAM